MLSNRLLGFLVILPLLSGSLGANPPQPGEPIEPPVLEEPPLDPGDPGMPTPDPSAPCCFTNPRYAGVCVVRPAADETCGTILAYLNDVNTAGKTYCNNTDIRGGWEWVLCPEPVTAARGRGTSRAARASGSSPTGCAGSDR